MTKRQREELERLAVKPQRTYGRHRTRVQRNLMSAGLAVFTEEDGTKSKSIEAAPECRITDKGRAALK